MKRYLIFAFMCSLLLVSSSYAEDSKPFSGGIFLGGRALNTDGKSANFNQYNAIAPGFFGGGSILYDKDSYYFSADGAVLGDDDMYLKLRGGKWGSFKYSLFYTEFPHNLSFGARSIYQNPGGTNQTFPGPTQGSAGSVISTNAAGWPSTSFDFKVRRKDVGGSFDLTAINPFFISVDANQLRREGQIPWAGNSGAASFKAVEFAKPIDDRTTNVNALAGWRNKQYYLAFGGGFSKYSDNAEFVNFRDPFTTGALVSTGTTQGAPDNKSWNLKFTGTAKLPLASTFALTTSYTKNTSQSRVLTTVDNGTATPASLLVDHAKFNGDVKYFNVAANLTSNPWKSLTTKLYFKYLDKKDDSSNVGFFDPVGNTFVSSETFSYNQTTMGAEGSYRIMPNLKGIAGYEFVDVRRRAREVENRGDDSSATELQMPETWDHKFTGQLVYNPMEWLGARLKYQKLYRNVHFTNAYPADVTDTNASNASITNIIQNNFRRFDIGTKNQDMVKFTTDLTPLQNLGMSLEYAYKQDDYYKSVLGLQNARRNEFIVDANYDWKGFKFFAFFDWDSSTTLQKSRYDGGGAGTSADPNAPTSASSYNWTAKVSNDNYAYGLGTMVPIIKNKLSFLVQYDFEKNNGLADFTSQRFSATPVGLTQGNIDIGPYDDYTRQSISARLLYDVTKDFGLVFGYMYSQFKLNDGYLNGYQYVNTVPYGGTAPTTAATANMYLSGYGTDQNYNVNTFYVKAMYKF